ncbi:MAG: hypothetical protein HY650_10635 [Acidobacteria bacterium]|nr:hypothetical protein [Acidobacteriota bacterium]
MQFFQDLGSLLERRWREQNYSETVFPTIAATALEECAPHEHVDPWDIIHWLNTTTQLPTQRDVEGRFGSPPLTLYDGPRFRIDTYYWLDGTTSIHQHGFCGAFNVLLGSSILSTYSFQLRRELGAHFSIGSIGIENVELLQKGDRRKILPGSQYIHSLFHLDRPSATVVIRTHQSPCVLPQYDYHKPYFALDPYYREAGMIKRVQSASLLLQMRHPNTSELISEALSCSDFQTAFAILELAHAMLTNQPLERSFGLSTGKDTFASLLEVARVRHGELVDLILPVIEEAQRQRNIVQRRSQITNNEHRFFLALLLNVPDRHRILDLVNQRFPDQDPVTTVVEWVEELANTRMIGSQENNVLGIQIVDDNFLLVFQCMLEGKTVEETLHVCSSGEDAEDGGNIPSRLEEHYLSIRNSLLFGSIFSDLSANNATASNTGPAVPGGEISAHSLLQPPRV